MYAELVAKKLTIFRWENKQNWRMNNKVGANETIQENLESADLSHGKSSLDPESRSRWLPKYNEDFFVWRHIYDKIFTNIQ